MRYIIYGAGAIGGAIGARLAQAGQDVVLIARGAHLEALQTSGLTLRTPDESLTLAITAVGTPAAAAPGAGDVVILAMKSQHTLDAVVELAASAHPAVGIVCAQNGVENERVAARWFGNVYGCCVMLPATHLEPGVVEVPLSGITGLFELGRYPSGLDDRCLRIADDLRAATFDVSTEEAVMRWKYTKLLSNVGNSLEAALGADGRVGDLFRAVREEATACYRAAGIEWASADEDRERRKAMPPLQTVNGQERRGGSSWQSLTRGAGNIEAAWLNGEIVLLGRQYGVPTPLNERLREIAETMAREGRPPGSVDVAEITGPGGVTLGAEVGGAAGKGGPAGASGAAGKGGPAGASGAAGNGGPPGAGGGAGADR